MPDAATPAATPAPAAAASSTPAPAATTTPANVQPQTGTTPAAAATPAPTTAAQPQTLIAEAPKADAKPDAKPETPQTPAPWKLTKSEGSFLTDQHVADTEAWARKNGLTEAQAREALARDDMRLSESYERFKAETIADKELGGDNLPKTIATSQRVLQMALSPEDRQMIAKLPIANHRIFHLLLNKVAALIPDEKTAPRQGGATAQPEWGPRAMYPQYYK